MLSFVHQDSQFIVTWRDGRALRLLFSRVGDSKLTTSDGQATVMQKQKPAGLWLVHGNARGGSTVYRVLNADDDRRGCPRDPVNAEEPRQ